MIEEADIDTEALERHLREKWANDRPAQKPVFDNAQQQRMAESLLGRDNTDAFKRRTRDGGRFRPTAVRVHWEYWWVEGGSASLGWWKIARFENNRKTHEKDCRSDDEFKADLARLRKDGADVREFVRDRVKPAPLVMREPEEPTEPAAPARRKSFAERYDFTTFRIGGR